MKLNTTRVAALIGVGVASLAAVASAAGVLLRGDGSTEVVNSVRGGMYEVAATGVYRFNAERVVAEGVGWDVVTLVLAVPALLIASLFVWRGSFRATLLAAGMLGYFTYTYLEYSVTWAFGPLFPLFVAITALSVVGLVVVAVAIAAGAERRGFADRFPRRAWAALSLGMSVLLTLMWTGRIWQALNGAADELLLGETTMTVQALDLGLMVPISVVIAWLAWHRELAGYVLATAFSVTFVAMSIAIASMLLSAGLVEGAFEIPPLVIFGGAATAGVYLAVRMFRSVGGVRGNVEKTEHAPRGVPQPA